MAQNDKVQLFEDKRIRTAWDEEKEEWYFSIVDVIAVLTDSPNPQTYWRVLKKRLKDEGNETVTSCNALKMTAADGKRRLTDVADTEQLLRIIQSIPSPKAEPFKLWLAQVGRERIEETIDPELTIDRALETYLKKGYSREWINQRLQAIQVRKELTDEWDARGVQKVNETRFSNVFIEKRVSSRLQSLERSRLFLFSAFPYSLQNSQNTKRIFLRKDAI